MLAFSHFQTKCNTEICKVSGGLSKRSNAPLYLVKHSQLSCVNREIGGRAGCCWIHTLSCSAKTTSYFMTVLISLCMSTLFTSGVNDVLETAVVPGKGSTVPFLGKHQHCFDEGAKAESHIYCVWNVRSREEVRWGDSGQKQTYLSLKGETNFLSAYEIAFWGRMGGATTPYQNFSSNLRKEKNTTEGISFNQTGSNLFTSMTWIKKKVEQHAGSNRSNKTDEGPKANKHTTEMANADTTQIYRQANPGSHRLLLA